MANPTENAHTKAPDINISPKAVRAPSSTVLSELFLVEDIVGVLVVVNPKRSGGR
jgi:hypothetical protein